MDKCIKCGILTDNDIPEVCLCRKCDREDYPKIIYAEERIGSNGIGCLDYKNNDADVKYIRADIAEERIKELEKVIGEVD